MSRIVIVNGNEIIHSFITNIYTYMVLALLFRLEDVGGYGNKDTGDRHRPH